MAGGIFSGLGSRPSGPRFGSSGSGPGTFPFSHPSSIQSSIDFGWPVAAPGGRWRRFSIQPSTQSSTQPSIQSSVIDSALCHRFRHLSSIQPSIQSSPHFGWPVAAPGGRWRRFSIQPSTQSSTQSSIQPSVIDSALPRFRWQVAAPGGRWQVLRPASSTQSSVIRHRFSHPFSDPFSPTRGS